MKLYELELRKTELMELGDEMLDGDYTLRELIDEVGYNLITIFNEDGEEIAEGYNIEDFTDEQLNVILGDCSSEVYEDADGYTCLYLTTYEN